MFLIQAAATFASGKGLFYAKKTPAKGRLELSYNLVEVSGVAPLSASEITPASPSAAAISILVHPSALQRAARTDQPVIFPHQPRAVPKE
jgi:hypothetical protein